MLAQRSYCLGMIFPALKSTTRASLRRLSGTWTSLGYAGIEDNVPNTSPFKKIPMMLSEELPQIQKLSSRSIYLKGRPWLPELLDNAS